jgi:WD40 repeat protein
MVRSVSDGVVVQAIAFTFSIAAALASAQAQQPLAPTRSDLYGDPLPAGAIGRLGTVRFRDGSYYSVGSRKWLSFIGNDTLFGGAEDTSIQFWDAATGRKLREIDVAPLNLRGLAISRDGKWIAAAGFWYPDDPSDATGPIGQIRLLDATRGDTVQILKRDTRDLDHFAMVFTPDAKLLISLGTAGVIRIEEIATGTEILQHKMPGDNTPSLSISPDGQSLAIMPGPNRRKLLIWRWQTGEEPQELKLALNRTFSGETAFSPGGKFIAWADYGNEPIHIWNAESRQLVARLRFAAKDEYVTGTLAFSPDGKWLLAPTRTSQKQKAAIHVWNAQTWQPDRHLDIPAGRIAISPDSRLLATGQQVFELATGKEINAIDGAHRQYIESIAPVSRREVATCDHAGTIRVWDLATTRQRLLLAHDGWVTSVAASPDGTRLASTGFDDTVRLWDLVLGREIYRLPGHGRVGGRRIVAFHPDGDWFYSFGDDMYLRIWDVATGKAIKEYKLRPTGVQIPEPDDDRDAFDFFHVSHCQFSPDGQKLVLLFGQRMFVFDVLSGKELRVITHDDNGRVHQFAISPDSRQLITGGSGKALEFKLPDGRTRFTTAPESPINIWDLESGQLVRSFMTSGSVQPLAYTPDGSRFAVAKMKEKAVAIYSADGNEQFSFPTGNRVTAMTFGRDGKTLITGMSDTSALIWDLPLLEKRGSP